MLLDLKNQSPSLTSISTNYKDPIIRSIIEVHWCNTAVEIFSSSALYSYLTLRKRHFSFLFILYKEVPETSAPCFPLIWALNTTSQFMQESLCYRTLRRSCVQPKLRERALQNLFQNPDGGSPVNLWHHVPRLGLSLKRPRSKLAKMGRWEQVDHMFFQIKLFF